MKQFSMAKTADVHRSIALYDRWLLASAVALALIGLLMVYSSSIVVSDKFFGHPFHFLIRHGMYLIFSVVVSLMAARLEIRVWQELGPLLLIISILLLILVVIPGIGRAVNGSMRWISFGIVTLQASECAKFSMIVYLAGYLVRRHEEVKEKLSGFIKPLCILALMMTLLLREPDFGAAAVMATTVLSLLFLAGVRWWQFGALFILAAGSLTALAISSPYRLARMTSFLDPWAHPYDKGYQLTQSLIAFGRGGWWGVGLGSSVQKLLYLPEAHTDFLFAVLGEELGLVGVLVVMALFVVLVWRALAIGRRAHAQMKLFSAYLAYGFGLWIALQALINMGVDTGVLPTKGLTLPLMSYGGNNLILMCVVVAILLRVDYETRKEYYGI